MNYAIIILLVLFLSLLWQPVSLIIFAVAMAAWLFLYFLPDEPFVTFGRTIVDHAVLLWLSVATVVVLYLTRATESIVTGLVVGEAAAAAAAAVHGVLRRIDDLVLNEAAGGVGSGVAWPRIPLKETASSSFPSS